MSKLNLRFWGEILPGQDPVKVKERFGKLFGIDNPERLEKFFSGDSVILRRNLDRKTAAEYYVKLHRLGVEAELVRAGAETPGPAPPAEKNPAAPDAPNEQARRKSGERPPAEAAERREAEENAARKRGEEEERKRKAAEAAARKRAEEQERKRREAEEAARQEAREEERKRAEAEEAARHLAEQKRLEAQENARRAKAEKKKLEAREQVRREEARKAALEKAEQQRRREEEKARARAKQEEQAAQRRAMEAQAIARGAEELSRQQGIRTTRSGVRTAIQVPTRAAGSTDLPRPRQAGEPNLYSLEPFRNTAEVRARAGKAQRWMVRAFSLAAVALALMLILGGRLLSLPPPQPVTGLEGLAVNPGGGPLLLAGDRLLLHDRSGTGLEELELEALGLRGLRHPMAFTGRDVLLAPGQLEDDDRRGPEAWPLIECNLSEAQCRHFLSVEGEHRVDGLAVHPLSGAVFVADSLAGEILKFNADGELQARSGVELPPVPAMRLDSGLLFLNSARGPAVSVFRYEDENFGEQLDEVLLLPPAAANTGQSRVGNFIRSGEQWWAFLFNPQDGNGDLFRFDVDWKFVEEARLPPGHRATQLAAWNDRLLVADAGHLDIQRFNAAGISEAPLDSDLLLALAERQKREARISGFIWRSALIICTLLGMAGLCAGLFLRMRSMVYRTSRERGAEPIDEVADAVQWIVPVQGREALLKRRTNIYLAGSAAALAGMLLCSVHPTGLMALITALAGPALALALLRRDPVGHIGVAGERLVLVDHRNVYHLGEGSRVQYRGPFLLIDDVVVFTGMTVLPAFHMAQVKALAGPIRGAGVRVDRTTIAIKLLQGRHALAVGSVLILATTSVALALLLLPHL